jgi:hypothetical protein
MNFYLIYIPNGSGAQWEAMSDISVPDPGAFPSHWYRKYEFNDKKQEEALKKLMKIRNNLNRQKVLPSKDRNIFPELSDILKVT